MQKDYENWHAYVPILQSIPSGRIPLFNERDIRWCSIGVNIGDEEDGKGLEYARPFLVIRKFNRNLFFGAPLTSRVKDGRFYFTVTSGNQQASVLLSQTRTVDARRLRQRIGTVSDEEMRDIKRKLRKLLGL